jgi:glutamyl-tRNA reductase
VIVVVGVSHREAPIAVRERLAVDKDSVAGLLKNVADGAVVREALCVSTCNRTEVYAVAKSSSEGDVRTATRRVVDVLERFAEGNGAGGVVPYLVTHSGKSAVRHLFRVASSLDSLVIGEPQILGQVKDAFDTAKTAGTLGHFLERAMSRAFHVAKRVRTETDVGAGQVSVATVAVDLARQIFGDLGGRAALLLGAGEMAEGAAKLLVKCGAKLAVVNRSPERGAELAREFGGTARPWEELPLALVQADMVVASTSAKHFVVTRELAARAIKARKGKSLFFIDIAVPRDVDPEVNELNNVYVYDIDNLSNIVAQSMDGRRKEADRAEALVGHEADAFESWAEGRNVTGTIVALRAKVRALLDTELDKTLASRLKHLPETDRQALSKMVEAAVNKLLHTPVSRIKAMASDPRGDEFVQAVHNLFDLPETPRDAASSDVGSDAPETETMSEAKSVPSPAERETLGR